MSEHQSQNRRIFLQSAAQLAAGCAVLGVGCEVAQAVPASNSTGARYDSYCGIYCGSCALCVKTESGASFNNMQCLGCKSGKTAPHCTKCKIKDCAQQKQLDNCAGCKQYPCEQLKAFHNNGRDYRLLAANNLEQIRDVGVEKWLQQQKTRWVCPKCKTRFSFRDSVCPKCHAPVYTAAAEAAALKKKNG